MGQEFGAVIAGGFSISGARVFIFERGVFITGPATGGEPLFVQFAFPPLGCPRIMQTNDSLVFLDGRESAIKAQYRLQAPQTEELVWSALEQRLCLLPTGQQSGAIILKLNPAQLLQSSILGIQYKSFVFSISLNPGNKLQDRQLYDVAVKRDDGTWQVIAPHALYYRNEWKNFGIAHITDLHVARRIDGFKATLMAAGRVESANRMINWNDSFRGFVKYANYLYSIGALDVILATGDLVDFLHENDEDESGPGNMLFFRNLILGKAPGPDFPDIEELRVPIFTVPGNHDYRKHPYYLLFNIDAGLFNVGQIKNYGSYNLDYDDALVFNHKTVEIRDNFGRIINTEIRPAELSGDSAAKFVDVDVDNKPYMQCLNNGQRSYIVPLGQHRIVMIDSEWDAGMVTTKWEAFKEWIGASGESESTFVDGNPDSEGVSTQELEILKSALNNPSGLVFVGIHAPPINVYNNEFSCYFRETQRATNENEIVSFLARSDKVIQTSPRGAKSTAKQRHPTWFSKNNSDGVPNYIKWGNYDDFMDYGVSRGFVNEFLQTIAGIGVARSADVILTGHGHRCVEYRIGKTGSGELAHYMDFYTQNPQSYYPFNFHTTWSSLTFNAPPNHPNTEKTYVRIMPGAAPDTRPKKSPADGEYRLSVPPYADPLAKSGNPQQWWAQHRPLVLQTGALGPLDSQAASFTGFRMLVVKNDFIDKIHYIKMQDLRQANYRLPWPPSPPDLSMSLRSTGQIVGNSVSLRHMGKNYGLSTPFSVRQLFLAMSF
jgi:3',5'-cyclic AMP phosphodiesterase CpdA